jgi:ribonucleoside-triphosphate reductase
MDTVRRDLAEFNFLQQYARYDAQAGRRETWDEASNRVLQMHLKTYAHRGPAARTLIDYAMEHDRAKRILSSQRARQFGGDAIERKPWRIYNCVTSYCNRVRFFQEAFWLLLCGCGTGFSVQRHHVAQLPELLPVDEWRNAERDEFVVEDTIEGWAEALGALIESRFGLWSRPTFDYTEIRPYGSPLSIGGKAPGSAPLATCLQNVERLLDSADGKLTPLECFDIVMYASDAVLAGGVRRAASIALFSPEDGEMMTCKTGNWFTDNPQRSRANISAVITPDVTYDVFSEILQSTKQWGEPGVIFMACKEFLYNPCVEIGMCPTLIRDPKGNVVERYTLDMLNNKDTYTAAGYTYRYGWQACNLTEVNCAAFKNRDDAFRAVEAAAILGTVQAGYTRADYLGEVSEEILERESLIGVSLTGMCNAPDIAFDPAWQREAAEVVNAVNKSVARELGLRCASRTTCVKPSGNAAILLGCASGIHAEYAPRYLRHVQVNALNPVAQFFARYMPEAVTESVWTATSEKKDVCIAFPIGVPSGSITRKQLSMAEFVDKIVSTQSNWVRAGVSIDRVEGLVHNVSNTILVAAHEWDNVADTLWARREHLSGVSLLGEFGDYDFDQPPFREVYDPETISADDPHAAAKLESWNYWLRLRETWQRVPFDQLREDDDQTAAPAADPSCAGGTCEFKPT